MSLEQAITSKMLLERVENLVNEGAYKTACSLVAAYSQLPDFEQLCSFTVRGIALHSMQGKEASERRSEILDYPKGEQNPNIVNPPERFYREEGNGFDNIATPID